VKILLRDFSDKVGVNKTWETIRDNIKIPAKASLGYYELKKRKEGNKPNCSGYRIQVK
jgi:hypothetical protein